MRSVSRSMAVLLIAGCFSQSDALAQWPYQMSIGPFRVQADFPIDHLRPLLQEIAALQHEIQQRFHVGTSVENIDVYLFGDRGNYQQYMRYYFPNIGIREAMYVKASGPGNVFACSGRNLHIDLRHECTHAILHAILPMVPLWLDEGLAEYFEVPADQRAFDNPYLSTIRRYAAIRRVPSLAQLESLADLGQMGPKEYRDTWAWAHFLIHGPEPARRALLEYFDDVEHHRPPKPISERLQARFEHPDREFAAHFRRWRR